MEVEDRLLLDHGGVFAGKVAVALGEGVLLSGSGERVEAEEKK